MSFSPPTQPPPPAVPAPVPVQQSPGSKPGKKPGLFPPTFIGAASNVGTNKPLTLMGPGNLGGSGNTFLG